MRRARGLFVYPAVLSMLGGSLLLSMVTVPAVADSTSIDFEDFAPGSPNGQSGWSATGSAGSGCANYDHQIVDNVSAPPSFGTMSLRISNAVTSGCFGDQTYSKSLTDEAGEPLAGNNGMSGGSRQSHFEAQWDFASTVLGSEQVGLAVVASPDRGDGARMSWIQMADTPGGLAVSFYDYRDRHPVGTSGNPGDGCGAGGDNFFLTNIASNLDRTAVHTIKVSMDFLDGPRNDVVRVWVDGALVHVDTSWEDYFRYCEVNPTRTVDSILFRTGGPAVPANAGNGFLIDNLSLSSGPIVTANSTGAWTLFPAQPASSTSTTTTETLYQADVRPPVKADGTSSFPKQRGQIPVQFDLNASTHTKVETTTVVGPSTFESITSDTDTANDYAVLRFVPDTPMLFADLNNLVADYSFTQGNCGGGALRWSVRLDVGNDGDASNDNNMHVYFGQVPSFTDCTISENNTGQNLIGSSDARFDLSQLGGPFYGTFADALAAFGQTNVLRTSLVLDGGWTGDQVVNLTGATSDGNNWAPLPTGTSTTIDSDTTTPYARTCTLPPAMLLWSKNNPLPAAAVNGGQSIQPGDAGVYYRRVDCKYIYNLDVNSLDPNPSTRAGTYRVWVNIGGENITDPATFELR